MTRVLLLIGGTFVGLSGVVALLTPVPWPAWLLALAGFGTLTAGGYRWWRAGLVDDPLPEFDLDWMAAGPGWRRTLRLEWASWLARSLGRLRPGVEQDGFPLRGRSEDSSEGSIEGLFVPTSPSQHQATVRDPFSDPNMVTGHTADVQPGSFVTICPGCGVRLAFAAEDVRRAIALRSESTDHPRVSPQRECDCGMRASLFQRDDGDSRVHWSFPPAFPKIDPDDAASNGSQTIKSSAPPGAAPPASDNPFDEWPPTEPPGAKGPFG